MPQRHMAFADLDAALAQVDVGASVAHTEIGIETDCCLQRHRKINPRDGGRQSAHGSGPERGQFHLKFGVCSGHQVHGRRQGGRLSP